MWLTEVEISKRTMHPMIYQQLAPIGTIVIEKSSEIFCQNIKKGYLGATLKQNSEGTRGFLANRSGNIQEKQVSNDILRVAIDRHHGSAARS